jgi:diacylglycerol kinase family enzyme
MRLRLPEAEHECELSNLSVLKTPHLSGGLRYDTPVATDDGRLAVNLCEGMGRLALIRMLLRLCRGCFLGPRGTRHWKPERVEVLPERPVALEIDGEVVYARRVAFDVLPRRLMVCAA